MNANASHIIVTFAVFPMKSTLKIEGIIHEFAFGKAAPSSDQKFEEVGEACY